MLARVCRQHFLLLTATLLLLAVLHTLWATSLDGFTIDEPYHITAGATYLRWGDYRINPEHPPLVKLAVALAEPASVLHLAPFPALNDKPQERVYTQTAVFKLSHYPSVHRRARIALIAFNAVLLGVLTILLRRVFSPELALTALLLLALDPTVSAHMPVVMTDLPLALLGTITCCLAVMALRCRRWRDWIFFGLSCGLLMGTKHSAPLILLPLALGCVGVLAWQLFQHRHADVPAQFLRLSVSLVLCFTVLWSLYGFHFYESREKDGRGQYTETFNRTLDKKIADLRSPLLKNTLTLAERSHLLPRAYLWGMADTLRAGVEGRPSLVRAFGRDYFDKAPAWIPFADLLVKVPLPFQLLAVGGVVLMFASIPTSASRPGRNRLPVATAVPMLVFVAMLVFFMSFIAMNGVFYAGLRHWLFAVPLLAVPAAACVLWLLRDGRVWVKAVPVAALLLIAVPTLPQRRIWEYHNILVGGSGNAWKYFMNESVDLGQRSDEAIAFYRAHVAPADPYGSVALREQMEAAHIHLWEPTPDQVGDGHLTGWFFLPAAALPIKHWEHIESLRDATPVSRMGDLFVYHGTFYLPYAGGGILVGQAMRQLNLPNGDRTKAEGYLKRAVILNPEATEAFVELGNFALLRKDKAGALQRYRQAVSAERDSEQIRKAIRTQIALIEAHPDGNVPPMRRPSQE